MKQREKLSKETGIKNDIIYDYYCVTSNATVQFRAFFPNAVKLLVTCISRNWIKIPKENLA